MTFNHRICSAVRRGTFAWTVAQDDQPIAVPWITITLNSFISTAESRLTQKFYWTFFIATCARIRRGKSYVCATWLTPLIITKKVISITISIKFVPGSYYVGYSTSSSCNTTIKRADDAINGCLVVVNSYLVCLLTWPKDQEAYLGYRPAQAFMCWRRLTTWWINKSNVTKEKKKTLR